MKNYLEQTWDELRYKVTWPTFKELQSSAILVLVASLMIALIIFFIDYVFGVQSTKTTTDFEWKGVLGFIYNMFKS